MAIFPGEPGLASFIEAKDDGGGGDNWSYKVCKAPVKSSPPTNQHPVFFTDRMPFLLPYQQRRSTGVRMCVSVTIHTSRSCVDC